MVASASSSSAALVPAEEQVVTAVNAPETPPEAFSLLAASGAPAVREHEHDVDSVEYWASRILAMEAEISQQRLKSEMVSVFDKRAMAIHPHGSL